LYTHQIKIDVRQYKTDEFVNSMRSFSHKIRKMKGCLGYDVTGILRRKIPLSWLESGRHARPWRNISVH
jgi:quinol monooxygenase YgiN